MLPEKFVEDMRGLDQRIGLRAKSANSARAEIIALQWSQAPASLATLRLGIPANSHPHRLASMLACFAIEWRAHEWRTEDRERLERWRRADKRAWLEIVNRRDKLVLRRRELYRLAAVDIAAGTGTIILNRINLADAARRKRYDGSGGSLPDATRSNRQLAAPVCRQIHPSDVCPLLVHRDSLSIEPTESALCGQCVVSTEPHFQRFP